jgi:hypothetical protein
MRPLSSCESTPRSGPRDYPDHSQSSEQSPNKFLPAITTFSRWRNATCDALDVIHWEANARVARQKGAEHPTILHLHLSRIIILTPYSHIRALAWSIASRADLALSEVPGTASDANAAQQAVIEWAQRDEHKARLAVLHAGSLFWHARRYSITAFYEPAAVFLATLVLWAYSSYTALASRIESHVQDNSPIRATDHSLNDQSQLPLQRSDSPTSSMIQSASDSTFILLDRPNDDEMVQLFVRAGHPSRMRAYMAGVGNLCSANGPIKICSEGKRVIEGTGSVWGCTAEYIRVLTSLEKAMVERYNC